MLLGFLKNFCRVSNSSDSYSFLSSTILFCFFFFVVWGGCWIGVCQVEEAVGYTTKCILFLIYWKYTEWNNQICLQQSTKLPIFKFFPNHPEDMSKHALPIHYNAIRKISILCPWSFLAGFPAPYLKQQVPKWCLWKSFYRKGAIFLLKHLHILLK